MTQAGDQSRPPSRYRVVQWATGNIGTRSLRAVSEHPDLELVGVYVHSDSKAGRDAGELSGAAPTGILATSDVGEIVALGADCVLYMPRFCDFDVVCRLLGGGTNIVTTRGEFHHAASMEHEQRARVEAACERGGTSIHSTGSSPGFISEALPFVLASIQRRLDHLVIDEFADLSTRNSPELLFDLMGFGTDPADFDRRRWEHGAVAFGPSLRAFADSVDLPLDSVEATGGLATARGDIDIAAGRLRSGTVAAQRMVVTGMRADRPLLEFRANWYCTTEVEPAWALRETGWRILVDGDAPVDVDIRFPVPAEHYAAVSPAYTANRAVNSVPFVCRAEPGILSTADLPQVIPTFR